MSDAKVYTLPEQEKIEVYVGERGHIVIKQDDYMGNEEKIVLVQPLHVPRLIQMLQAALADAPGEMSEPKEAVETSV